MDWRIERRGEVTSTSDLAKEAPAWTAVVAESQTAGRGRLGRPWHSPRGGLWLSAAVPPPVPAQTRVAKAVAAALSAATGLPIRHEPPNDLVLLGRKLGGVLVEVVFRGEEAEKGVVGVGVNVNNPARELPAPVRETAISLVDVMGDRQELEGIMGAVLAGIEQAWKEGTCRPSR